MKKKFIWNLLLVLILNLLIKPFYILGIDAEIINRVGPSVYGNCALDEARWFNKRLSQEEVTALYNNPDKFYWWYDGTNWVVGD